MKQRPEDVRRLQELIPPIANSDTTNLSEEGPGCLEGLCEGPAAKFNICQQGGCNPRICIQNPFLCGGWTPEDDTTPSNPNSYGCQCPEPGGSGGDTGNLPDPSPKTGVPATDPTTPTITEPNPTTGAEINPPTTDTSLSGQKGAFNWPANAQGMNELLGEPGTSVPDTANTPGRGQMRWEIRSDPGMRIVGEQHPYLGEDWHWHVDPGHYRGYPGTPMPDWLVKILTDEGYL